MAGPVRQRIAMLLENNPYPQDVRVRREAEALAAAGHRVRVIAPRDAGQPRRETIASVEVRRFRAPLGGTGARSIAAEYAVAVPKLHLAALRELAGGATVLHLHNPPDLLVAAGLLARLLGRRVVFDHHDLFPELVAEKTGARALAALARAGERATFAVSSLVLATNESMALIARERGRVAPGRVAVVRNGPPAAWLDEPPAPARAGALSDPQLVYVGAVSSQDGVAGLAEVMRRLTGEHGLSGARLTIVGEGDAREPAAAAMRAASVEAHVRWLGWTQPAEVLGHIRAADICVDPAPPSPLNHRSTMIKIAEYMAAGRPVVAYDLTETRHTLGATGVLADPGEPAAFAAAIARLAGDGAARAALAAAARERAAELTWERSEEILLAAYDGLGRGHRPTRLSRR